MMIFKSSLGVDFRRNHLILTLLKKSFGKIRLLDYRIYPLWSEGQKEVREAQWLSLITTFISKHQIDRDRVSIAIPREKLIIRFIRLPIATKENLRNVLAYEAPQYTPFDKEDLHFDYQVLREDKEWVYLVAAFVRKGELDPYLSLLKKIGMRPVSIQIPSAAALNLFFYHQRDAKEGAVLVDIQAPFFEMNTIQERVWKDSFHLPLPADPKKGKILQIFQRSNWEGEPPKFFLYGLDEADKVLPESGEIEEGVAFYSPPLDRIDTGGDEAGPDHIYSSIGLPLKGLVKTRIDLNLLPLEMRKKVRQFGRPLLLILAALALVLGAGWGARTYSGYQDRLEAVRAEVKKKKPEVEAVERLLREKEEMQKELSEFTKATSEEISKLAILRELANILPPSVWIWNLKYSGKEVEISGFADSASGLISLMDKSPLFEKVEFLAPVTKERERRAGGDQERERFKIKMRLEGRGP